MSDELSNCPFCGGEVSIIEVTERQDAFVEEAFIQCEECGFSFHHKWLSAETLIEYWNTRAERTCSFSKTYDDCDNMPTCSACGWEAEETDCVVPIGAYYEYDGKFCKECGARVIKDEHDC